MSNKTECVLKYSWIRFRAWARSFVSAAKRNPVGLSMRTEKGSTTAMEMFGLPIANQWMINGIGQLQCELVSDLDSGVNVRRLLLITGQR